MMLLVSLALLVVPPASITVDEATRTPARQLASRLLPAAVAARVIDGRVRRDWLPGQAYTATFWEAATPSGRTMCRRRFHGLRLANPTASGDAASPGVPLSVGTVESGIGYGTSYPRTASMRTCHGVTAFATPAPAANARTVAAIDTLTSAMRIASGRAPLPFTLTCAADDGDDVCARSRSALATLPLDALFGVSFDTGHYRTVGENRPGVVVRQMIAAPDGSPPTPTIQFGMSGGDGHSWRVELISNGDRLSEIRMRRSMIIYH